MMAFSRLMTFVSNSVMCFVFRKGLLMASNIVHISADNSPLDAAFAEAKSLIESLDELRKISNVPLGLPDTPADLADFVGIESDNTAAAAGEMVVRFYPSDCFLGFLAACRARYAELLAIQKS